MTAFLTDDVEIDLSRIITVIAQDPHLRISDVILDTGRNSAGNHTMKTTSNTFIADIADKIFHVVQTCLINLRYGVSQKIMVYEEHDRAKPSWNGSPLA